MRMETHYRFNWVGFRCVLAKDVPLQGIASLVDTKPPETSHANAPTPNPTPAPANAVAKTNAAVEVVDGFRKTAPAGPSSPSPVAQQSRPAAIPASAPLPARVPANLWDALLSYKWSYFDHGHKDETSEFRFVQGGTVSPGYQRWAITGPHTVAICWNVPGNIADLTFNDDFSGFTGVSRDPVHMPHSNLHGSRLERIAPLPPESAASESASASQSASRLTSAAAPAAARPVAPTPVPRPKGPGSHLANFVEQWPVASAWALAPLDVFVPPAIRQNANVLKAGLTNESAKRPAAWRPVYSQSAQLCDLVIGALQEKEVAFGNAGGRADQRPQNAGIQLWNARTEAIRPLFHGAEEQFRATLASAGGISALPGPAEEIVGIATLPPVAAPIPKPPPKADDSKAIVNAGGPSGTNFGWGERKLKLHVSVVSGSELPVNLGVDCYWVGWNGKHHTTSRPYHRNVTVYGDHPQAFDVTAVAERDNGATFGILGPAPGVYRGWVVAVHNAKGQKIGGAANMPEFMGLAK
jgi:hypothetical protein